MVASAAIVGGAALLGTAGSMYAADKAAGAQKRAARDAAATQEAYYTRQEELQEPFRQAGLTAQNKILTLLGLEGGEAGAPDYGRYAKDFSMSDFVADPGYGFRMSEGMKAVERSAAARGGLLSGSTLKGIQRFGQDTASNEYINAFNRYQTNRSNQINPLQSLMGAGQSSTNLLSNAAGQTGQGVAGAQLAGGQARASGYANMSSALNQGLSNAAGFAAQYPMMESTIARNNAMTRFYGGVGPVGAGGTGYGPASNAALYNQYNVPSGYGAF